jgi:hypothetical protein
MGRLSQLVVVQFGETENGLLDGGKLDESHFPVFGEKFKVDNCRPLVELSRKCFPYIFLRD